MSIPNRTFGVEIECCNLPHPEVIAWHFHKIRIPVSEPDIAGINYGEPQPSYRKWDITSDGSLSGPGWRLELRSRILRGADGIAEVRSVCRLLKSLGAQVNASCGFHVHVGASRLRPIHLYTMLGRYNKWERDIDRYMASTRRKNRNGSACTMKHVWDRVEGIKSDRHKMFRSFDNFAYTAGTDHSCKIDFDSLAEHGTIEFRHHHGTIDPTEASNWIQFCLNFTEVSADLTPGSRRSKIRARDNGPLMGLPSRVQEHFKLQCKRMR